MTSKDLLDATMRLDQSFLDEADIRAAAALPSGRKRIRLISALTAAAACLAAVIGLRFYSLHHNGLTEQNSAPDSIVAEVSDTETTTAITETTASDAEAKHTATTIVSSTKTQKSKNTESTATTAAVSGTAKTNTTQTNTESKGNTTTTQAAKSDTASSTTATTSRNRAGTTVVPYLLHVTWEIAEQEAKRCDLKVTKKIVDHFDGLSDRYAGCVAAQSIEYNTEVEKGTVVELTVLAGEQAPEERITVVPEFIGMTWPRAEYWAMLRGLKLTKEIVTEGNGKKGTVQSQSIGGDSEVERGTNVTLTVLEGEPDPIRVEFFIPADYYFIGKYHICLYENGKLVTSGPQFQPRFSLSNHTLLYLDGEGIGIYDAVLVNDETGEEAKLGRYFVDFDAERSVSLENQALQAYRQLGGIAPDNTLTFDWSFDTYIHFPYKPEMRRDEVQFKIPSKPELPIYGSTTYKIVAYADGIALAESGWFDASVPDSVITMTLEDDGLGFYGGREYLFELYREDLEEPTNIGRAYVRYSETSEIEFWPHMEYAFGYSDIPPEML